MIPPDGDKNASLKALSIQAGLEPFAENLTTRTATHLLRRLCFGADPSVVETLVGRPADEVVDEIIDDAITMAPPADPEWADLVVPPWNNGDAVWQQYVDDTNIRVDEYKKDWIQLMLEAGFREKLTLFWHNHFVTNQENYFHAQIANRYVKLLRTHAFGNFKNFVTDIGQDGAMLVYLNGIENYAGSPNENYARELLELFTMGILNDSGEKNYTEFDIQEMARCLTGWQLHYETLMPYFEPALFDSGTKTVFGNTNSYDYDQLIDLIFQERELEIARFICRKFYREFVYEVPDESIVQELASTFVANNFEIEPVLRLLLKSGHFFDDQVIGAKLKTPMEMMIGFYKEVMAEYESNHVQIIAWASWEAEQVLLNIPSVAGWPRHRNWIDTRTIPARWGIIDWMVWVGEESERYSLDPFMNQLVDTSDPLVAFKFPVAIVEALFAPHIDMLDIENITSEFAGDLQSNPIPDEVLNGPEYAINLAKMFLSGVPWYEWNPFNTELDWIRRLFIAQITRLPEYQMT